MDYLVFERQGECYLLIAAPAIERHPVFFANLLSGCVLMDAQGHRLDALDVWQAVAAGRWEALLARYLTAHAPRMLEPAMRRDVVAIKRSISRQDGVCTVFQSQGGAVQVLKCTLAQAAEQVLLGQPIFPGVAYDIYLRQLAACGDWLAWRQALRRFVEEVFRRFPLTPDTLQGAAIDAIARNAVLDEGAGIAFFDLEFADYAAPSKTFFIYRLCLSLMGRRAEYLAGSGFTCLYEVYCHLCSCFALDARAYVQDVCREAAFQSWVSGQPIRKVKYGKGLQPFAPGQRLVQKLCRLMYALRLLAMRCRLCSMTKRGRLMTRKACMAGYLLLLLAVFLQDWTPLLLYLVAMVCRDYLLVRRQLEQVSNAEAG